MKTCTHLVLVILCLPLAFNLHAQAPASPGVVREFKDLLKDIPPKDFFKLHGNTRMETAMTMSEAITLKEVNHENTFRMKVGKVEVWPYPDEGVTGWRVHCEDEKVKQGSLNIIVSAWAYVRDDPDGLLKKLRPDKKIVITGKLTRADLTVVNSPILNIDMSVTSLSPSK